MALLALGCSGGAKQRKADTEPPSTAASISVPSAAAMPTASTSATARWRAYDDQRGRSSVAVELPLAGLCPVAGDSGGAPPPFMRRSWPARRVEEEATPLAEQVVRALAARSYAEVATKVDSDGVCIRHQFQPCVRLSIEELRGCGSDMTRAYQAGSRSELTCRELMSEHVVKPHFAKARPRAPSCELAPAYVPGNSEEDKPPRVLVQLLASRPQQPEFPWDAVTVGFEERDGKLVVVEIAGSHWTP